MAMKGALISVSDKTGVVDFARGLAEAGFEIISSGGTAEVLAEAGVKVNKVADLTGAPEILDGRVKTLHPKIHGGILADRRKDSHVAELAKHGIAPIDLVVVNLYPFEQTVARPEVTEDDAIENIDIGGPAMVRAAAKNWHSVAVVVTPDHYDIILDEIKDSGEVSLDTRRTARGRGVSAHVCLRRGHRRLFRCGRELARAHGRVRNQDHGPSLRRESPPRGRVLCNGHTTGFGRSRAIARQGSQLQQLA